MILTARDQCPEFTTKDSSLIRELMAPRNSAIERQSLAEATLHPDASTIAHYHPLTEEIYYILSGEGMMAIEHENQPIGPGHAIGILAGKRHQIRNTGAVDLVFLCCCVPAYTDTDTIECDPLLD
jgi:mannose-6-phosphate isomerase-like protein (cupin superfamily)